MKIFSPLLFLAIFYFFKPCYIFSQSVPVWTASINTLPDSANLFPVKVLTDGSNNIYVLSSYSKNISPGTTQFKIYLNKYDLNGNLLWNIIYDNGGGGDPRGFDMAIDLNDNCYISGGLMSAPNFQPLLLKFNSSGTMEWMLNTITSFNYGYLNQVILKDSLIYIQSSAGIATVNLYGIEQWSQTMVADRIAVDGLGRLIVTGTMAGSNDNIFRFTKQGALSFSDSTIYAKSITTDFDHNIYLLTDISSYALVKLDSSGAFQWSYTNFPPPPPFGDIGLEVLTDFNNDILVAGVDDSLYKFNPFGAPIWTTSLNGLGTYKIAAKIAFSNVVVIAGSLLDTIQTDVGVATFDINGNQNWSGSYNSNTNQEFVVDMSLDNSGIYILEDSISNPTLLKFESPFSSLIDYSLICVDSVWYDIANPNFINVSVFNGNNTHLNYPSVQIISPTGDTIGNHDNLVNFFAHLGNQYQTYTDTITVLGIADFSNYTFLISEGFGTTTAEIDFCSTTRIQAFINPAISIYPNPASETIQISGMKLNEDYHFEIFDVNGRLILKRNLSGPSSVNVDGMADGLYFARIIYSGIEQNFKFFKE